MAEKLVREGDAPFDNAYVRQKEWVERRGFLLLMAFFVGAIGTGIFLVSQLVGPAPGGYAAGSIVGFAIVAIGKSVFHLLFLGRPERFWRGLWRPQSSWISRGLWALILFIIIGLVYLAPNVGVLTDMPVTLRQGLQIATSAIGGFLILYDGFLLATSRGIPFWNSAMLPVLFFMTGLLGGSGGVLLLTPITLEAVNLVLLELLDRILLGSVAVLVIIYVWSAYYTTTASRRSVTELTRGFIRGPFLGGVIVLGLVIPLAVATYTTIAIVPHLTYVLGVASILGIIGDFFIKYSVLKAGIYSPFKI